MKRKIKSRKYVTTRPGGGLVWLKLECGHEVKRDQNCEPKKYCSCKECDYENKM